jgi:hypothetical protein
LPPLDEVGQPMPGQRIQLSSSLSR